jgi:hypothetical protein
MVPTSPPSEIHPVRQESPRDRERAAQEPYKGSRPSSRTENASLFEGVKPRCVGDKRSVLPPSGAPNRPLDTAESSDTLGLNRRGGAGARAVTLSNDSVAAP